jgi:hypothetical protein
LALRNAWHYPYTLKEKIERLGASNPRLFITDRVPEGLESFDFVFVDSVSNYANTSGLIKFLENWRLK